MTVKPAPSYFREVFFLRLQCSQALKENKNISTAKVQQNSLQNYFIVHICRGRGVTKKRNGSKNSQVSSKNFRREETYTRDFFLVVQGDFQFNIKIFFDI